jgi:translation elongation factor EF-G
MKPRVERKLLEAVAEFDETLMEKYFEDSDSITEERNV